MTNFEYYGNNGRVCREAYLEKYKLKDIINQDAFLDWLGRKHESTRTETYTYDSKNECRSKNIFPYYSFIVGEDTWFSVSDEFSDLDKAFDFFDFLFEKFNHRLVRMYFNTVGHGTGVAMSREGDGDYLTWENDKEQKIVHDALMKRKSEKNQMTNEQKYKTVDERTDAFLRSAIGFYSKDMYEGAKSVFEWLEKKENSEAGNEMKKVYTVCSQHNVTNIPTNVLFKDKDFDNFEDAVKYCKSMKKDNYKFNFSVIERWV